MASSTRASSSWRLSARPMPMLEAQVGGLDDDGVTEFLLHSVGELGAGFAPALVGEPHIVHHGYAVGGENHLHRNLVHAVGRRQGVAPGIGYAYGFEDTFENAVLTVGAMEHGYHHVEGGYGLAAVEDAAAARRVEIVVAVDRAHEHLGAVFEQGVDVAVVGHVRETLACEPAAVLGDVDRHYVVVVGIDGGHGLARRYH